MNSIMKDYHIGIVSHVYGTQYGDSGGSQNYCYYKIGFVEDKETHKRYYIFNMSRRELPYHCNEGLTRVVYFNKGQKVLFKIEQKEENFRIAADNCDIKWNYENNAEAIIIGVINKDDKLVIPVESEESIRSNAIHGHGRWDISTLYTEYKRIDLKEWLEKCDESFLTFYGNG